MSKEKTIDTYEVQVKELHPSWNNADIRAKAVRMFYFNESL